MKNIYIDVAKDFSSWPNGRRRTTSESSGESFREDVLVPLIKMLYPNYCNDMAIDIHTKIIIDFSDVAMAGSSFLDESFGGLYRNHKYDKNFLIGLFDIRSPNFPAIVNLVKEYIQDA